MKDPSFHRPTRLEDVYRREIHRLIDSYLHIPDIATLGELNVRLVEYGKSSNFLQKYASVIARRMVTQTLVQNERSWRAAARKSSRGSEIYQMLRSSLQGDTGRRVEQLVAENARLIKSVPQNVAGKLTAYIQQETLKGRRSSAIMKDIAPQLAHMKRYEIQRLARTEVAKADTAVTRTRAEAIGLNWYQWQTAEDGRVRDSHKHMDKVLVNWNDSPSPEQLDGMKSQGHYNAGNIYNCRCVCLPIVTLNEISFPAKVYSGGSIKRLSKSQFALLSGMQRQIAA